MWEIAEQMMKKKKNQTGSGSNSLGSNHYLDFGPQFLHLYTGDNQIHAPYRNILKSKQVIAWEELTTLSQYLSVLMKLRLAVTLPKERNNLIILEWGEIVKYISVIKNSADVSMTHCRVTKSREQNNWQSMILFK